MTNDEIICMAREAGGYTAELPKGDVWSFNDDENLKRFAHLIAACEREACAKVCEQLGALTTATPQKIAASIRARVQS